MKYFVEAAEIKIRSRLLDGGY